ncbi:hypothetical protein A2U01_0085749, partial [Trifolium medium]|nr:hypothetical protein [Trifolium medium]
GTDMRPSLSSHGAASHGAASHGANGRGAGGINRVKSDMRPLSSSHGAASHGANGREAGGINGAGSGRGASNRVGDGHEAASLVFS